MRKLTLNKKPPEKGGLDYRGVFIYVSQVKRIAQKLKIFNEQIITRNELEFRS